MSEFVPVACAKEFPENSTRCVEVDGVRVALFNLNGEFYATQEYCTHAEASLCDGDIEGDEILCPLHFATFDIRTGACTGPPADEDLQTFETRVVNDVVEVKIG